MATKLDQGTFNASLAEAIQRRDLRRIGRLCDQGRAAGMTYGDIASRATRSGVDAAEWESILYEVDALDGEHPDETDGQ